MDFEKFNKKFDIKKLREESESVGSTMDYGEEIPTGDYEVSLEKLELTESKKTNDPMVTAWFKIVSGEFKGRIIFMNQVVTLGFQIHNVNCILKEMDAIDEKEIVFEDYAKYNKLLDKIFAEVNQQKLEFALNYSENNKGYKQFKIAEVFEN